MTKKVEFPETLYVTIDNPGSKDECILAWDNLSDTSQGVGNVVSVGVYELVERKRVTTKVEEL